MGMKCSAVRGYPSRNVLVEPSPIESSETLRCVPAGALPELFSLGELIPWRERAFGHKECDKPPQMVAGTRRRCYDRRAR